MNIWNRIIIFFVSVCTILLIGSTATPRWIQQGEDEYEWKGGLFKCGGCHGDWEDEYYSSIANDACDIDGFEPYCVTYEDLFTAGIFYVSVTVLVICAAVFWDIILAVGSP